MIYCTPTTGDRKNIVLGYLDSGVSALTVSEQFVNINCGSVDVKEYFNDARDYSPYTTVEAYLPFIGMVKLKTEDIIGSKVTINYYYNYYGSSENHILSTMYYYPGKKGLVRSLENVSENEDKKVYASDNSYYDEIYKPIF